MKEFVISGVRVREGASGYEAVEEVRVRGQRSAGLKFTVAQVIAYLKLGDTFVVDGAPPNPVVIAGAAPNEFIKSLHESAANTLLAARRYTNVRGGVNQRAPIRLDAPWNKRPSLKTLRRRPRRDA